MTDKLYRIKPLKWQGNKSNEVLGGLVFEISIDDVVVASNSTREGGSE